MSDPNPDPQHDGDEAQREWVPRAHRARIFKKGKMIFENGLRSIPCTVRNLAEGGALLEFEQAYLLPTEFELFMELADYEVTCERRWEDGLRCGVQFISEKRQTAKQREQVLQTSEQALKRDRNLRTETADGILDRKRSEFVQPEASTDPRAPRGTSSGKRTFGKRR